MGAARGGGGRRVTYLAAAPVCDLRGRKGVSVGAEATSQNTLYNLKLEDQLDRALTLEVLANRRPLLHSELSCPCV